MSGSSVPERPASERPRPQRLTETGQQVFRCLSLGLVVFDHQLEIVHHNPAAAFLVRDHTSIADALTSATVDAQYEDWRQRLREVVENGREHRFEHIVYRDDQGSERLLNLLCVALTDQTGSHITGGTLVVEDVTAAASMEKRLAVSERMAAVGKLAARVAHELNNPLDGILRYLNLATRALETSMAEKVPSYLDEARGGLLRMSHIVRQLVEFSRSTHATFDGAGLNALVEEAVSVMSDKAMANNVSVVCNLNQETPAIGSTNLFQVFCNLIKNAIDAMPDGGTLTVTTEVTEGDVTLVFEDTGVGLPEEMGRLFEPFFTTKEAGKGTGLGLAICRDIIEKYNGTITPERRPGGGAIFRVRLPLQSGTGTRGIRPAPVPAAQRSRFTSPAKEAPR